MANIDLRDWQCNRDLLHQALLDLGCIFRANKYTCPSPQHDDHNPSCSIHEKDGKWKWRCHACNAGGDVFDLMAIAQGGTAEQVIAGLKRDNAPTPVATRHKAPPQAEEKKTYATLEALVATAESVTSSKCAFQETYNNPDTAQPDLVVLRMENEKGKQFWPVHAVEGGWQTGYKDGPRPIYNRARVRASPRILVVEGEKCVRALHSIGIVATTSPGGANGATRADWSPLAGRTCIVWRDNDEPGLAYQDHVVDLLSQLAPCPDIRVIDINGIAKDEGDDVADYIARERAAGVDDSIIRDMIESIIYRATPQGGSRELFDLINNIISGKSSTIEWPWDLLTDFTHALEPATVTLLCGDPGAAKSFFLLQCMQWWYMDGVPCACLELECDRAFHLQRALVQIDENNLNYTRAWIRNHPDAALANYYKHKSHLDGLAAVLHEDPDVTFTLPTLADWVVKQCEAGKRIIAVDPLTIVDPGAEPWISERNFMVTVKRALRKSGSSLILVLHPKKNRMNTINMDQLAGSSSYPRFSDTVLWLEHHPDGKVENITSYHEAFGARQAVELQDVEINKTIHMCKTRLGSGNGLKLGYKLTGKSMTMSEIGLIGKLRKN